MDSDGDFPEPFLSKQDQKKSVSNVRHYSLVITTAHLPQISTLILHGEMVAVKRNLFTTGLSDVF